MDHLYLDLVGQDTFYGIVASLRGRLFRDADFAGMLVWLRSPMLALSLFPTKAFRPAFWYYSCKLRM